MVFISETTYNCSYNFLKEKLPAHFHNVRLGIICGSGLGGLVDTIDQSSKVEFPYGDIPGFVTSTVSGHSGKLVFGYLGELKTPTVFMVGRIHLYEGYSPQECTFPVRIMKLLGVETLVVTNACGALNPEFKVGDLMVINDHLSLAAMASQNPLIGPNIESFGPRFPPVSDAYTYALRKLAFRAAFETGISKDDIREGVYTYSSGPMYESRSEARFLKEIGADVVGMSTVHEVLVARHADMKVLGLSLITNPVVTARGKDAKKEVLAEMGIETVVDDEIDTELVKANHAEVLEASANRANDLQRLMTRFADLWAKENN
ncbi:nucleoside phosphorylase domain-containing protein [Phascolomyces articulosus]|uniref:Purine nucleoside phosphorylase n=1 Tax=Phascolomyces articulosus TaxID=60185 RepID=A0AAD5K8I3_9FUNG|nr:nucleoside phosphorylase domain-containing protein [Phascolomyces articulosus]